MNPHVPVAVLVTGADVRCPTFDVMDCLKTDSYLPALGIMEGRAETPERAANREHMSYLNLNIRSLLRAPIMCLEVRPTSAILDFG